MAFHLFSQLHAELRCQIYWLATPPRIVHVEEEHEDFDEFVETLRTVPTNIKIDPSLAYFAFNWRHRIPTRETSQSTLERFGFTGAKPSPHPWKPTPETPEIPLIWLSNNPKAAWEMIREGFLYSRAAIPPLLHTYAESRAELMRRGYGLRFRTRTSSPRTWFNFERDVLYLEPQPNDDDWYGCSSDLLTGGRWDIGQFDPAELKQVRNVALYGTAGTLVPFNAYESPSTWYKFINNTVRLFSCLRQLYLIEWTGDGMETISGFTGRDHLPVKVAASSRPDGQDDGAIRPDIYDPWRLLSAQEIDGLLALIADNDSGRWWETPYSAGEKGELLKQHKMNSESNVSYFEYLQVKSKKTLLELQTDVIKSSSTESTDAWQVPEIAIAHLVPSSMVDFLFAERRAAWEELLELKRTHQAALSPSVLPERVLCDACCGQCLEGYRMQQRERRMRKWWIEEGTLFPPAEEIIM